MAAVGITLTASAQKTEMQMATLQHGNQTRVFYVSEALINAYNAAADTSDVITLSSGEFVVPNSISKSIAIYGVGFENDEETGQKQTRLKSGIVLVPANSVNEDGETIIAGRKVNNVHLEGLCIDGDIKANNNGNEPIRNLEVIKCKLSGVTYSVDNYNNIFRQCVITYGIESRYINDFYASNLLVSNCYIGHVSSFPSNSTIKINHCIVNSGGEYNYTNSIIYSSLGSTASVSHCIFIENASFSGVLGENNWTGLKNAGVWAAEGEDGSYAEDKDFALKYPDRYIGTDGTEVGLHGGAYPWNKIPSIPRITECTIDTENAANGTIKLSIKAEAQTKE